MAKYLTGTYTSTYVLTVNPTTIAVTGLIDVNSPNPATTALVGNSGVAWTITNLGTVESLGSEGFGINLQSGGLITNEGGGYIGGAGSGIQIQGTA